MSILMGIMAVLMVLALVSGHRHIMGGHEKEEQKQESINHDRKGPPCDDCPAVLDMKDGNSVKEDNQDKNKTDAEVMR